MKKALSKIVLEIPIKTAPPNVDLLSVKIDGQLMAPNEHNREEVTRDNAEI